MQDYRLINEWTIKNRYPLPLIPQLIDQIGSAKLITVVDICWGYNTVQIVTAVSSSALGAVVQRVGTGNVYQAHNESSLSAVS